MSELTDKTLGEFHLLRHLGSGGMADVYLAEQTALQRYVAVKVMKPKLMALSGDAMVARFKQEAMAAAGLNHPNIVQVYTIGQEGDLHYIAQEYVEGKDLSSILKTRGKPDLASSLHIMRQVISALKAAGAAGIVHRDIKPENILITKRGEVKVADFGLAQLQDNPDPHGTERKGTTMGTPLFMSPEQVSGKELDPRSDIYSFGVTCYQLLCGETPFHGSTPLAIARQHLKNTPPPLKDKNAGLPDVVCRLVHRMMAKRRGLRYQSADEVGRDLKKLITAFKQGRSLDLVRLPRLDELDRAAAEARLASQPQAGEDGPSESDRYDFELGDDAPVTATAVIERQAMPSEAAHKKHAELVRQPLPSWSEEDDEYHARKPRTDFDEMDLTPMVDVTFLLLIFFMITASFSMQKSFDFPPVQKDEGAASVPVDKPNSGIKVSVEADNTVFVEATRATTYDEIFALLEGEKTKASSITDIDLEMDPDSSHVMRVIVIDAATQAGYLRIRNKIKEL
jgi:serine/threonine protein kinase